MSKGVIDLENLVLDEMGRVVLDERGLASLEAHANVASAGANSFCQGGTNGGQCGNGSCGYSTNSGYCINQYSCTGSSNKTYCT